MCITTSLSLFCKARQKNMEQKKYKKIWFNYNYRSISICGVIICNVWIYYLKSLNG